MKFFRTMAPRERPYSRREERKTIRQGENYIILIEKLVLLGVGGMQKHSRKRTLISYRTEAPGENYSRKQNPTNSPWRENVATT